jgi:hypothetical protein
LKNYFSCGKIGKAVESICMISGEKVIKGCVRREDDVYYDCFSRNGTFVRIGCC